MLGNWTSLSHVNPSNGLFELTEEREHNLANEIEVRDEVDVAGDDQELFYDEAGNLIERRITTSSPAESYFYTYDAWNRLTQISFGSSKATADPVAQYEYNGLNWRTRKVADTDVPRNGTLDEERLPLYNADWQLIEESVDDLGDPDPPAHIEYVWGSRGLNDIVMRRFDADGDGDDYEFRYYLTDPLSSPMAIINDIGEVIERISYDAYGRPRHHMPADVNGDGNVNNADQLLLLGNWGNYGVGDIDLSGTVGNSDNLQLSAEWGIMLPDGELSLPEEDNIIGFAGYLYDVEAQVYHVRNRYYDADLGRWLNRDPAGYVDGSNLYLYVSGRPIILNDPSGLHPLAGMGHLLNRKLTRPVADLFRRFAETRARQVETAAMNSNSQCAAAAGSLAGDLMRLGGNFGALAVDPAQVVESAVVEVDHAIEVGEEHGVAVGAGELLGTNNIAEAIYNAQVEAPVPIGNGVDRWSHGLIGFGESTTLVGGPATLAGKGLKVTRLVNDGPATSPNTRSGGRLGSPETRQHVRQVANTLESRGWTITGGGGRFKEEYIRGPGPGTRGSAYPDITATKNGHTLRINTVDTLTDGVTPTARELQNAAKIRQLREFEHLLLLYKPKN